MGKVRCVRCTSDVEDYVSELEYLSSVDIDLTVTSNLGYFASIMLRHGKPVLPEVAREVTIYSPDRRKFYIYIPPSSIYSEETKDVIAYLLAEALHGVFFMLDLRLASPKQYPQKREVEVLNYILAEPRMLVTQSVSLRYTIHKVRDNPVFRPHVERAGSRKARMLTEMLQTHLNAALEAGVIGSDRYDTALSVFVTVLTYRLYTDACPYREACSIIDNERLGLEHKMLHLLELMLKEILAPLHMLEVKKTEWKRENDFLYRLIAHVVPRDAGSVFYV